MLIKENNIPIGMCGLFKRTYLDYPDLGYALLHQYHGKGYAIEAAASILDYCRSNTAFNKILGVDDKYVLIFSSNATFFFRNYK